MHQSRTAIESELLDLGGVTLEQLRALDDPERERNKQRLLQRLNHLDTSLGDSANSKMARPCLPGKASSCTMTRLRPV